MSLFLIFGHVFMYYSLHPHIYFTHPYVIVSHFWACVYVLQDAPSQLLHAPPMSLFLIFGLVFYVYFMHLTHYSCILLLLFFSLLSFFLLLNFFLKKIEKKNFNYKKLQKIEKSKKRKMFFFCFIVSVRLPAPCDTHFKKYQK